MQTITMRFFRQPKGFLAVTDQCPKGFDKVVFVAYTGPTPDAVVEIAVAANQVRGEEVELHDMPVEWLKAFGCPLPKAPEPLPKAPEPEPTPRVKIVRQKRPLVEYVVKDEIIGRKASYFELAVMVAAAAFILYFLWRVC